MFGVKWQTLNSQLRDELGTSFLPSAERIPTVSDQPMSTTTTSFQGTSFTALFGLYTGEP